MAQFNVPNREMDGYSTTFSHDRAWRLKSPVIMTMLTILDPDDDRRFLVNFDFHPVIVRARRLFFPYSFFLFPDLSSVSIFFPGHEAVQPTICSISLSTLNAIFVRL